MGQGIDVGINALVGGVCHRGFTIVTRLGSSPLLSGTIRVTVAISLPDEVVRDIVQLRMDEIVGTGL